MYTNTDYSKLIQFAKEHPELSRTSAISEARKVGIKTQKKGGLEALRVAFDVKQGTKRGAKINELGEGIHYTPPPKKPRATGPRNYVKLNLKQEVKKGGDIHYLDGSAESVKRLKQNINTLYAKDLNGNNIEGYDTNKFFQISLRIKDDGYTKLNDFSLMFPYDNQEKYAVKRLGHDILDNLNIYYSNLAKRYSNKNSYKKLKNDIIDRVKITRKALDRATKVNKEKLQLIFAENGIDINSFQVLKIIDSDEEREGMREFTNDIPHFKKKER